MKEEFNKCYNDYLKKLFLIIINYIIVNIVLIIFYFSGEIKYDVFISFLFFGNIMYLIYRIPTIKSYINIKRIKKYLKKGKGKLQEVVFWNNLDTMFFLGGIICCKKKIQYIDYNEIKSIYQQNYQTYGDLGYPIRGSIFNHLILEYLVIVLKNGMKYRIKIDVHTESDVSLMTLKIDKIITFLLNKNSKIVVKKKEKHSSWEEIF